MAARWIAALLFALNFLATLPLWTPYFGMEDEAVTVLGAQRLLGGEWPYYHWDTRHTPGSYLLSALYFAVVGSDRLAARSLMGLLAAATGVLVYLIARRVVSARLALFPWVLWCCGGLTAFPILSYHWWATFWTLLSLYWALRWRSQPSAAPWLGLSSAAALWTLQSDGLASALMALLIWLRYRPPGLLKVVLFGLIGSLLLWLPFLPVAGHVWRQNVTDLAQHLPYNRRPYSWEPWLGLGRLAWSQPGLDLQRWALISNFWLQTQTYGLYYLTIGVSLAVFEKLRRPPLAALAWCALGWALASGNRQTVAYLSFSCPALFLCQAGLVSLLPRPMLWACLWAGLEILGHGVRCLFVQQAWTYPIPTRTGVYRSGMEQQARAMLQVRRWVDGYLPPGSTVLAYPYFCSLYTTENLRNPLRVPVLTPFLYDQQELLRAKERLTAQRVEWVVYLELSADFMQASYGIPADLYRKQAQQELDTLTADYQLYEGGGTLRLYRRKEWLSPPAGPTAAPPQNEPPDLPIPQGSLPPAPR
jgi:hypothetical protein